MPVQNSRLKISILPLIGQSILLMYAFTLRAFSILAWVLFFTVRAYQDSRMVLSQDEPRLISFELHARKKFIIKTLVTVVL